VIFCTLYMVVALNASLARRFRFVPKRGCRMHDCTLRNVGSFAERLLNIVAVVFSRDVSRSHKERQQFGGDLGSFQISQEKLARMLANIQARPPAFQCLTLS